MGQSTRSSLRPRAWALAAAVVIAMSAGAARAAEFGTGPWLKGYTDVFAGIVPTNPGLYVRTDAYHYEGDVGAVVFNGNVQVGVDQRMTAALPAMTYVTPWKIFGGTFAFGAAPSIVESNVDVGLTLSAPNLPIPVGPIDVSFVDSNVSLGDTALAPAVIGWHSGNFYWNTALFVLAPNRQLQHQSTRQYGTQSLGVHAESGRHLF